MPDLTIFGSLERIFRRTTVIHRARKAIQGGDCCPRRMSLLRCPWLLLSGTLPSFPIRNPSELRGLHRRSYFGPRTCVGGITNVIEVSGALNQGFPFSPIEGGVMRMSHFISQTLWNTMRAADPCPTNNAKRAKHSKILKPGCFFVFTLFYQLAYNVLCENRPVSKIVLVQFWGNLFEALACTFKFPKFPPRENASQGGHVPRKINTPKSKAPPWVGSRSPTKDGNPYGWLSLGRGARGRGERGPREVWSHREHCERPEYHLPGQTCLCGRVQNQEGRRQPRCV